MRQITEEQIREVVLHVVEDEIETLRQELGQPGPEWSEVRQVWQAISALAEAQRRTEERLERLEATVQALAEAQRRTEERLEAAVQALVEAQRSLEERIDLEMERIHQQLGQLANRLGLDLEADAEEVLWALAEERGFRILRPPMALDLDGEIDLVTPVEMPDGKRFWVLIEVKGRLRRAELGKWLKRLQQPSFQQQLQCFGVSKPYLPYAFGLRVYAGVDEMAQEAGIGILTFRGERIPPRVWE